MKRRRSMRLPDHDYREHGSYFVTICTHNAVCLFGKVEDGETILSNMGNIAFDEWLRTARVRSNVELDAFVVMPNHIHGIICIFDDDTGATHRVAPTAIYETRSRYSPIKNLAGRLIGCNRRAI